MKANSSPMSVADYCQDMKQNKIIVNKDYQRSEGIWSGLSRSYFIESILLEYPIPKLYLYAKLDLKSRQTIKEIVDGQQRSHALRDFFNNKLRISTKIETEELRGKKYAQLNEEWQTRFLEYSLPIDQFSGTTEEDVQEAFRRMNSSNVPLNDEEQRNARFQGDFKWFIISIAKEYRGFLTSIGLFSKRDIIRMSDLKVYSEIVHALDGVLATTKGSQIDALYKKYNASFELEDKYHEILSYALNKFASLPELQVTPFLRGHVFQSIILALIAHKYPGEPFIQDAQERMRELYGELQAQPVDIDLLNLCLVSPLDYPQMINFIEACSKKTNVATSKIVRFLYFYNALK